VKRNRKVPAPGNGPLPTQDRREAERYPVELRVRLTNFKESFRAVTVDVSRTGMLFRLLSSRFYRGGDGDLLLALTRKVEMHFPRGLTVVFGGGVLRRRMRVVRTTLGGEGDGVPLVACRFHRPLTAPECLLLGIPPGEEDWESWDAQRWG